MLHFIHDVTSRFQVQYLLLAISEWRPVVLNTLQAPRGAGKLLTCDENTAAAWLCCQKWGKILCLALFLLGVSKFYLLSHRCSVECGCLYVCEGVRGLKSSM